MAGSALAFLRQSLRTAATLAIWRQMGRMQSACQRRLGKNCLVVDWNSWTPNNAQGAVPSSGKLGSAKPVPNATENKIISN
jgi:hypothetical protein